MELALAEEPIPSAVDSSQSFGRRPMRAADSTRPVWIGTPHGMGVQPLARCGRRLSAQSAPIGHPWKASIRRGKTKGKGRSKGGSGDEAPRKTLRKPDPQRSLLRGLVFKILPYKTGDLLLGPDLFRSNSRPIQRVLNSGQGQKKENVAQLWRIHATKKDEQTDEASRAGDIVGIIGLRESVTGDTTLRHAGTDFAGSRSSFPETVISMAIEPESTNDRKKLGEALAMLRKQDPTFDASENEETGQTLISGMGELHLEVIQHRLMRDFNLKVKVHKPRVSYRETVRQQVEADGECNRLLSGVQHTATVRLRVEPFDRANQSVVVSSSLDHGLPPNFLDVVLEELDTAAQGSGLLGFPLTRLKVTVVGGEVHPTDSTDIAFRTAANVALDNGLRAAHPVLLEPIMRLEISTPPDHVGDLVSDLQQRRAIIHETEPRTADTVIHAEAPLANLFGYSSAMRSLSQGRANCSMEPSNYAPAPDEVVRRFLGEV